MIAKVSTIGEDLSKDKPDLNKAVKLVFEVGQPEMMALWPVTVAVRSDGA